MLIMISHGVVDLNYRLEKVKDGEIIVYKEGKNFVPVPMYENIENIKNNRYIQFLNEIFIKDMNEEQNILFSIDICNHYWI